MWKLLLLSLCLWVGTCRSAPTNPDCQMVYCFVQPCAVARCPRYPQATCQDNYCSGCTAEFYLNGRQLTSAECGNARG